MRLEVILTIRFSKHSPLALLDYSFCTPLEYLCAQVVSRLKYHAGNAALATK